VLDGHARAVLSTHSQLTRVLGLKIEGVGPDALLFTFDIRGRECRFALDLSGDVYKGPSAPLPPPRLTR
jgi:hypothetical protein